MQRKLLSILTAFGLVAGLLSIGAPALADAPTDFEQFMPSDESDKDQLSDQFDGVDENAHLTVVATPDTSQVTWYACAQGGADAVEGDGFAAPSDCLTIGADSSGTAAVPPGTDGSGHETDGSDEAYEFDWNIPGNLDGEVVDIVARACTTDTDDENCSNDIVPDVRLDNGDSTTGGAFGEEGELPSGEIVSVCRALFEECDEASEHEDYDDTFGHGDTVPEGDFSIYFRTSDDIEEASACINTDADAATEPTACDIYAVVVQEDPLDEGDARDGYNDFVAAFTDVPESTEGDLAIFGRGGDDDFFASCTEDFAAQADSNAALDEGDPLTGTDLCVLDEHYVVSGEQVASGVTASYWFLDGVDEEIGCQNGEEPYNDLTNYVYQDGGDTADDEWMEACLRNQFGDPQADFDADQRLVFEVEGDAGEISQYGGCEEIETDDRVHTIVCDDDNDTDGPGLYYVLIEALYDDDGNVVLGTSTIVVCLDDEGADPDDAEFGCDDEDEDFKDSVVKNWTGQPETVSLVFQGEGQTPAESCDGGDQFRLNVQGDVDTLVACTFDSAGRLTGTLTDPVSTEIDGGRISWTVSGAAVAFGGNPPNDTGNDGTVSLDIEAVNEGSATVTVTLCWDTDQDGTLECGNAGDDEEGTNSASITKTVQEQTGGGAECNDGIDNDGDGDVDYPADDGCSAIRDDTENSDGDDPTTTFHDRTIQITRFAHVTLPGKSRPALKVRGVVNAPGFESCHIDVPVKVQIRAGGEWVTRKTDTTNSNGVFKVLIRDVRGRYRAVATRFELSDPEANTLDVCRKAKDVRRHRH